MSLVFHEYLSLSLGRKLLHSPLKTQLFCSPWKVLSQPITSFWQVSNVSPMCLSNKVEWAQCHLVPRRSTPAVLLSSRAGLSSGPPGQRFRKSFSASGFHWHILWSQSGAPCLGATPGHQSFRRETIIVILKDPAEFPAAAPFAAPWFLSEPLQQLEDRVGLGPYCSECDHSAGSLSPGSCD